jgi:8-oxo-dGTP pyrophosphatase MutT (NUDIX family)
VGRVLSCGVIVRRAPGELLLGHATGRHLWDIPKGVREADETSIDAALRELKEETGLVIGADRVLDLGLHRYLPRKDLQLFLLDPPEPALDIAPCTCSTYYPARDGLRLIPEVDAYRWGRREELADLCGKHMTRVLLSLDW